MSIGGRGGPAPAHRHLLTGTVQWQKGTGTASRVRGRPELVQVEARHAPSNRWSEQFDAAVTDVFAVQADIATRVAAALNLVLADSVSRALAAAPTAGDRAAHELALHGLPAGASRIPREGS